MTGTFLARSRRAFTLVELLVVCALTAVLGIIVVEAVTSIGSATAGLEQRTVNQLAARNLFGQVSRALTAATPLGTCGTVSQTGPGGTAVPVDKPVPIDQCGQVLAEPFTLAAASTTSVSFYANADNQLSAGGAYSGGTPTGGASCYGQSSTDQCGQVVPDQIFVSWSATSGLFSLVRCEPPPSATYTNPPWPVTQSTCPAKTLAQTIDNVDEAVSPAGTPIPIFQYYDSSGNLLTPSNGTTLGPSQLTQVADVKVTAAFNTKVSGYHDTFTLMVNAPLSGASANA